MRAEIVLTISIAIMYMSCVLYLQIAFWMPTLASKLWCINTAGRVKLLLTWGQLWLVVPTATRRRSDACRAGEAPRPPRA